MTAQRIEAGDIVMAYELCGPDDAPIVCLNHCFATDHRFWDPHLPALRGFRVLRFDTRGHGNSDKPPGDYTLRMLANDVIALLDALALERVHFCGVSLGGMIGQTLAIEHHERLASLALVNSTCEYSAEQRALWQERAERVLADGIQAVLPALMARWFTDDAAKRRIPGYDYVERTVARFPPASFAAVTHAMRALDTCDQLGQIVQPTLVVAAPDDPGVPVALSERLAARIPSAELHWLTPARHLASLEHIDMLNQLLRAFLLRVSSDEKE